MTEAEWLACNDPARMLRELMFGYGTTVTQRVSDRRLRLFACACAATDPEMSPDRAGEWAAWSERDDTLQGELASINGARYWCGVKVGQMHAMRLTDDDRRSRAALLREVVGNPWRPAALPPGPYPGRTPSGKCASCGRVAAAPGCGPCARRRFPCLTTAVLSLARAAYDVRLPGSKCPRCGGSGRGRLVACMICHGTGRVGDGTLDPDRLKVLADALEEAGCPAAEKCRECDGKGEVYVSAMDGGVPMGVTPEGIPIVGGGYRRCKTCEESGRVPSPLLAHLRSPGVHVRGCWVLDRILGSARSRKP